MPKPFPLPGDGGLVDTVSSMTHMLFNQTIHQKPQAFGFLSRVPRSVVERNAQLARTLEQEDYSVLWPEYGIRYL